MLGNALSIGTSELVHGAQNFTFLLIRLVLAVGFSVAPEDDVDALATGALELAVRTHWAVLLVTLIITLWVSVTSPCQRDAVDITCGTGEVVRCAGRWVSTGELVLM